MDAFQVRDLQPETLAQQLEEFGYLPPHINMDGMAMLQDPRFMAPELREDESSMGAAMIAAFDESDPLNVRRSISDSSSSAQSQSPPFHGQFSSVDIPHIQPFINPFTNSLEQISPVTAASSSRRNSDDESHRAERRRAQNRAAQRAYRHRKDQSLKQREVEIESLREELDRAQRLNKTLCKVVAVLRGRIKNPSGEVDET